MYNKRDQQTSKNLMWLKDRSSWIDQLRSQAYPPFHSSGLNYKGQEVSWEEQAFAEDTLMHVWPPRSYSCTFCRREFRSAQALGGHMNVHRRDRARLRQQEQSHSDPNSLASDEKQSNPNPPPSDSHEAHNPSPDNCNISPSSVSVMKYWKPQDPNRSAGTQTVYDIDEDDVLRMQKDLKQSEILVVGNLKRKHPCPVDLLEDYAASTKRRCITSPEFSVLSKTTLPIQLHQMQKEITMKSTASPIEELDLELRLGNCPTVT